MKNNILSIIAILSMTIISIVLPLAAFAAPTEGDRCTTDYIGTLVGSDGGYYYRNGTQTSIKYLKDGTTEAFSHVNYDGPRRHYLIMPDGQDHYYGYCIEQGLSFPDANRYSGIGWNSDPFLNSLPETVRNGILLATIYGRQPNKKVPVSGCNDDDWYWATQVIIWEYQQKLRLSPTKIQGNGYVPADYFHSTLDGRPAEKCYNYILSAIEDHQKIPSFTSEIRESATMNVLKWDCFQSLWHITLHDENQVGASLRFEDNKIKLSRNGDEYNFSAKTSIAGTTLAFKKDIDLPSHDMLVWGSATGTQSIVTGTADPLTFYMRFRTEQPGTFEILKESEDGVKEGFTFQLTDSVGKKTSHTTNKEGSINTSLLPGSYLLTELEPSKYRHPNDLNVIISENKKTTLHIANQLKKGKIRIEKTSVDSINQQSLCEFNAKFQIFPTEFQDFDAVPQQLKDEITTDAQGIATTKELPLGQYIIRQTNAEKNIAFSEDRVVEIVEDLETVSLSLKNMLQKGKIEVLKTDNKKNPLPGAVFTVRAAEDIAGMDGKPQHKKGELVGTLVSDAQGLAATDWLYPGKYHLEEIIVPNGYFPPKNPVSTIDLAPEDQFEQTFILQTVVLNEPIEDVPNTGDMPNERKTEILYSLLLIGLNGMVLMAYLRKERNKTLR
jgi:hypothetical protein